MFSRRQRIALISASAAVMVGAGVAVVTTASAAATRYEAESAPATCDGAIESNHAGYSGSGFCNADNAVGAAAQFTVTASAAGPADHRHPVRQRHHRQPGRPMWWSTARWCRPASAFGRTGAWTTWATKTLTVSLNAGSNTIRLSPTTAAGLANIDYVDVEVGRHHALEPAAGRDGKQMEDLNRGLISVRSGLRQPGVLAAAGHRARRHRLQRLPRRHQAERVADHQLHQLPRRRGGGGRLLHGARGGQRRRQAASEPSLRFSNGYLDVPISSPGLAVHRQRRQRR